MSKKIFADFAHKYHESGFSIIPVRGKKAFTKGWNDAGYIKTSDEIIDQWVAEYQSCNIGLCLGPASGIVALDYDYDDDGAESLEIILRKILPNSPCEKVGKKGFTMFAKYCGLKSSKYKTPLKTSPVVEFFSSSGQVVIPPSIHPETLKPYVWKGSSLLDIDKDDLPTITEDDIRKCYKACDNFFEFKKDIKSSKGRHSSIVDYGYAIVEDADNLEEFCSFLFEYDKKKFGESSYFNDESEKGNRSPVDYCRYIAESIINTVKNKKEAGGEHWAFGKNIDKNAMEKLSENNNDNEIKDCPIESKKDADEVYKDKKMYDRFVMFFEKCWYFKNIDVCYLAKEAYLKRNGKYTELWNELNTIKSLASDWWLPDGKTEQHLARWIDKKKPRLMIDLPLWDGKRRIDEMLKFVSIKNIEHSAFIDLQKDWLAGIFKRLKNPEFQNRVNLWEGKQGIGKDTYFINLLRGFGRYKIELNGDAQLTDIYSDVAKSLVICLPELDQFRNLSPGSMKDLISSPGKTFRSPYDRKSKFWPFMYSVYSTANVSNYLKDPTGNRRFWVFEIDHIDFNYPKFNGEELQIVAEIYNLFMQNYEADPKNIELMSTFVEGYRTPGSLFENLLCLWDSRSQALMTQKQKSFLSYEETAAILIDLQKTFDLKHRQILTILKQHGRSKTAGKFKETNYYSYDCSSLKRLSVDFQ